jgi:Ca-activated chloride channel family protein
MKTHTLIAAAIACLSLPSQAQAPVVIPRPSIAPPRIEIRQPDVGPMQTREMSVSTRINGLHAVVETTVLFHNPNARDLEGELIFPLPDGAAVCGYALDIGGIMVEGVIATKERARVAFETETRRNVDPGLVEHVRGNLYRTRIYPLPANGQRRIRLTYTTPLVTADNGDAALLLPIPREPIAKLNVAVEVSAGDGTTPTVGGLGDARFEKAEKVWRVESSSENTTPGEDILIALPKLPASFHQIERTADDTSWFMITTMAPTTQPRSVEPGRLHILWDASGSRAGADLTREFELLNQTKATSYLLTVFRDVPEAPREFASVDELISAIKAAPCDGGTDLAALATALRALPAPAPGDHSLLFTDGFDTLSGSALDFGGPTPTAIVSQTLSDREALRQACAGALIDLKSTTPTAAWAEIENPSGRVTGIEGTGIAKVQGIGQPAHGRIHLLGQLTGAEATVHITYADGTKSDPFTLRRDDATEGRVLITAWAAARINQLAPRAEEFADELLALGQTHGLVSPATSLIVLETLDQWVRHKIEPPASLPDLRRQWRRSMKALGKSDAHQPAQRLEQVVALWQERVAWWKTDFSKAKAKPLPTTDDSADPFAAPPEGSPPLMPRRPTGGSPAPASAPPREMRAELPNSVGRGGGIGAFSDETSGPPANATIAIKPWSPKTPYLKAIRAAKPDHRYTAYLAERAAWAASPAFFLDCAELFYQEANPQLARRILSNLAELRIEDPGLLRVLAWRLQQAGDLATATVVLRRVAKLRPEEPQSFRDLALVLALSGRTNQSKADLEEALQLFHKVALGTWDRHGDTIAIFALEEMNALIAWTRRQEWPEANPPQIPEYDKRLAENLDTDIRIVMAWDADATDIDLHVIEPGGEEAFYGHNRTGRGGLVSDDIIDGCGPEEYLIRVAPTGSYTVKANYFGSDQQTVIGPATVTATVFTHWGRTNEQRQTLTIRLNEPKEDIKLGKITFTR